MTGESMAEQPAERRRGVPGGTGDDPATEQELSALRAEVEQLRARVARLEAEKAEILRRNAERDYERPPHYR